MATQATNGRSTRGGTHEQHVEAGRKGGEAVSRNRQHMAEIGRRGGLRSHGGTHEQHVEAGRKGGEARHPSGRALAGSGTR